MKKLHFEVSINAPKEKVWDKMLQHESYKIWTTPFSAGSYYEGSWEKGAKIKFLADTHNEGMIAEIAENKPYEFLSIRHLGYLKDGVEDTTSEEVKTWLPAYENYTFVDKDGKTTVMVDLDSAESYAEMMGKMWPEALEKLKEICEK